MSGLGIANLMILAASVIGIKPGAVGAEDVADLSPPENEVKLLVTYRFGNQVKPLMAWDLAQLKKLDAHRSSEQDPFTKNVIPWKGVRIENVIKESIEAIELEERANIDLVVLKNAEGVKALVPRYVVTRFPVFLAYWRNGKSSFNRGPNFSMVPWTSRLEMKDLPVPLESYFVPNVTEIELSNYENQFADVILKNTHDPAVKAGEKVFVKACMTCHAASAWPTVGNVSQDLRKKVSESFEHPNTPGLPHFGQKDREMLQKYIRFAKGQAGSLAVN